MFPKGNLSAVCRSADAFGMGAVHAINGSDKRYKQSQRTAAGADKWLHTRVWDSTSECLTAAKGAGFQIVATHLSKSSVTIPVRSCCRDRFARLVPTSSKIIERITFVTSLFDCVI